ncbi:MAG TPA: hypothetical protein P5216_04805, partial [Bacteroidota bacterium]|nr:hypothetical protein [Bacteroidota bacterium]
PVKNISEYFKIGDVLPLKVVEFDKDAKKIVLSAVEALRGKDQSIIDEYNSQHPVPNVEQYQTYEVKFESLREEIASMESETESYLRQEVNFYPSLEEAFEEIKEEKIEIKNTEPLRLADIQAKIHEVTPQKEEKNEQPVEQNENSNNAEVETKTDEKSQTDEIQIAEETKDSSSEEINPEEDTTEN